MTEPPDGYTRVMLLAEERPDLLPLVRLIFDMGDQEFSDGLAELTERGILDKWEAVPARPL